MLIATLLVAVDAGAACVVPDFATPVEEQLLRLPQCQRDPVYLAQIGRLLNAQKRYGEALDHLERALMFDSESAEIQLDYALALAGEGDSLSAAALLDTLLAQTALPDSMRLAVEQAKNRLMMPSAYATQSAESSALRLSAQLRVGNDSNLLGSPRLDQLEISLPNEVLTLPLDDTMQPRAGAYHRTDARMDWAFWRTEQGVWEFSVSRSQRRSPHVPEADSFQDDVGVEYTPKQNLPQDISPYAYATRSTYDAVRGAQFTHWGVGAGVQSMLGGCSTRWGGEWQDRLVLSNPLLSGIYSGVGVLWRCGTQWQFVFKMGEDRPQNPERAGGRQRIASLRSLFLYGHWLWDTEFSHTRDSTGYSPLLDYDAVRSTNRVSTRLEYQIPLGQQWVAALGAEWSRQDSNLALFQVRSWGTYASLRWVW